MFVHELARKWGIQPEGVIAALYKAQHEPRRDDESTTANAQLQDRVVGDVERVLHSWTLSGAIDQYRM